MKNIFGVWFLKKEQLTEGKTYSIVFVKGFFILFLMIMYTNTYPTVNNFNHLTIKEGLSQSTVTSLFQDSYGFLWIGTMDGLNRYDGYNFTVYSSQGKSNSLSSLEITALEEDQYGRLWVGTYGGLDILDKMTKQFKHIPMAIHAKSSKKNIINVLFKDSENCIWAGTSKGIVKFRYGTSGNGKDSLEQVNLPYHANELLNQDIIQIGSKGSSIWVLTQDSLGFINPDGESLPATLKLPQSVENAKCIFWDDNRVYVGSEKGTYYTETDKKGNGWRPLLFNKSPIDNVNFIKKDLDRNIWIGTSGNGVYVFDVKESKILNHRHIQVKRASLNSNVVNTMVVTKSGMVGIGTDLGVNLYDKRQALFNQLPISVYKGKILQNIHGMIQDKSGNIWIGTKGDGIFISDLDGKILQHFAEESISSYVKHICQDRDGYYWIGTNNKGIYKIKFRGKNYTDPEILNFRYELSNASSIPSNAVNTIFEDVNGDLWFGTSNGLSRLLYSEKKKKPGQARFINTLHDAENEKGLLSEMVYAIYRDRLGVLWVGTLRGGLGKIINRTANKENSTYETEIQKPEAVFVNSRINLNDFPATVGDNIHCIYEDKLLGNLWIGTNDGLCRYNREKDDFRILTTENGLPNNTVYGILEDQEGCLWLSTNNGLSKYNQKEDVFYNFNITNGLQYPEFNGKAYLKADNGLFIFGGAKGINAFKPENIKQNTFNAPVYITGFKIRNNTITTKDESHILKQPIYQTSKIELKHDQNFFSISFALLNFKNPGQNRFAYKLEGYQDEWIYVTGENSASFTGIPPGEYRFLLKGSDGYSIWETKGQELIIEIAPPLWFTIWAKLFYLFVLTGIIYLVWRSHKKRMHLKLDIERQHLAFQRNQELYEKKFEFYANISHEFLTPLTLIIGPIQDLIIELKEQGLRKKMILINRSALRLRRLIDQILSLRKLDEGELPVNVSKKNIGNFVWEVVSGFNSLAVHRNIRYHFEKEQNTNEIWFDPDILEKILYNLLSNAFKYTSDGGDIAIKMKIVKGDIVEKVFAKTQVETNILENYVAIAVKDNGTGISKNDKERIFELYYQAEGQNKGFGIGLSFSQKLAQLHQGIIDVKSKPGKGSTFILYLPVTHYKAVQRVEQHEEFPEIRTGTLEKLPLPELEIKEKKGMNRVLLVEDNDEMRYYIADALGHLFSVMPVENGRQALLELNRRQYDLIISDIVMPEMDGMELLQKVRTSTYSSIPFILLSAINDSAQKKQGLDHGADAYISKPFEIPYLITVVNRLLQQNGVLKKNPKGQALDINIYTEIESADSRLLNQFKSSIEEHYANPDFNVNSLAKDIGLSRSQLHRRFKAITGETPSNFLKEIRMKEAVRLLETTPVSVFEVCYAVGFSDPKYFSREFRKKYGMSPSVYAKSFHHKPI